MNFCSSNLFYAELSGVCVCVCVCEVCWQGPSSQQVGGWEGTGGWGGGTIPNATRTDTTISALLSHKTVDTAQPCRLLKPNWKPSSCHSISTPTNINTQFLLQSSLCVCVTGHVCVCVCVCDCVCVCVCFHMIPYVNCLVGLCSVCV